MFYDYPMYKPHNDFRVCNLHISEQLKRKANTDFESQAPQDCPAAFSDISMNNVTFQYPCTTKAVLDNFHLQISKGDRIAIIGEKGLKLSGGQRQRIVLARLFLRNVDIYIFDEATSALDQHSETLVQDTIKNLAKDKTLIIVAHRESSVRLCNRVVKIN